MASNVHAAPCVKCGKRVEPGGGLVNGKDDGGNWKVIHTDCIPVYRPKLEYDL